MYCVAITFKVTKQVEQQIYVRFCVKFEHSSLETIRMIQKAAPMGKWWLTISSRQCTSSCITFWAEVFGQTSNHPGDSAPLQPRFGALRLLDLPQTKTTFVREEISDHQWDSGKCDGTADGDWENCVRSQDTYFEGDWGVILLYTVSCILYLLQKLSLFFIVHGWIPSG